MNTIKEKWGLQAGRNPEQHRIVRLGGEVGILTSSLPILSIMSINSDRLLKGCDEIAPMPCVVKQQTHWIKWINMCFTYLTGTGHLSVTRSGHRLTVSWLDLFTSPQAGLLYVVHIGTEPGSANVVDQLLTGRDEITLSFTSQHSTFHYLFITVSAVDQCGLSGYLTKRINLN